MYWNWNIAVISTQNHKKDENNNDLVTLVNVTMLPDKALTHQ